MTMKQAPEYELIQHSGVQGLEIFLVQLFSRSLHGHSDFELGLVLEGSLTLHLGDQGIPLHKNDIYAVNRYQPHSFSDGSEDILLMAVQFSAKMYDHLDAGIKRLQFPNHITPSDDRHQDLYRLLLQCADLYFRSTGATLMPTALLLTVISVLQHHEQSVSVSEGEYARNRSNTMRMNHLLDYILRHYTEPMTLRELADQEGISVCHLSHLFRELTGMSFQKYLADLRFEHALHLVEQTKLGILDICAESGFSSSRYLNRAFQERFSMDVAAYRSCRPGGHAVKGAGTNEIRLSFADSGKCLRSWLNREHAGSLDCVQFSLGALIPG